MVAKAWSDPAYKTRLFSEPRAALAEMNIEAPEGITLEVVEDTRDTMFMVLPASPAFVDTVSNETLDQIANLGLLYTLKPICGDRHANSDGPELAGLPAKPSDKRISVAGDEEMLAQDQRRNLGRVIAKTWSDSAFKERLKANPKAVLAENGIETPERVKIEILENNPNRTYLTLPSSPIAGRFSDEILNTSMEAAGHTMLYDLCERTHESQYTCYCPSVGCPRFGP